MTMAKTWFITGASRGFGALIAEEALQRGDNAVATARNPAAVTDRLGKSERLLALALDVTDEAQARAAADAAVQRFGTIDILLNNAGFGLLGAVEEATAEEIERVYRTNVFGLLAVTRAVLPHMRRQRSGHVLNISSIGGYAASAGWGVYCSTKFAVEGLTEALALELKPLGIRATVIEPGFFRTDFLDASSLATSGATIADYAETAGAMRQFAAGANHAQPGDPAKLARAILGLSMRMIPRRVCRSAATRCDASKGRTHSLRPNLRDGAIWPSRPTPTFKEAGNARAKDG
jgi:NAD(P)-dependent dehydrogenase (short-subunit alcohol dehydrogenase family)